MDKHKLLKIALVLTYICFFVLVVLVVALPMLVTWYVEVKGRSQSLPTTILVTCYPCAPFIGASLLYLSGLIKNALSGEVFSQSSVKYLKRIATCCAVIAAITLFAGRYYLPFYMVGGTFAFVALLIFAFRGFFICAEDEKK